MSDVCSIPCFFFLILICCVLVSGLQVDHHEALMIPISSSLESPPTDFDVDKVTFATERNPMQAMVFALRYLKMEPREDGPWGNFVNCSLGEAFTARPDLAVDAGICTIITSGAGSVVASNASDVAVSLDKARLSACVFNENKMMSLNQDSASYIVHTTNPAKCCLACQADEDCLGANYAPGWEGSYHYQGFGFHLPATRSRLIGRARSVEDIERIVASKVDGMTEFDAWMDFNLGVFTRDIDSFIETLETDGVLYFPAKWPLGAITMYSLFINVPTTQVFIEVMGSDSRKLEEREIKLMEQRMPESKMLEVFAEASNKDSFTAVRISRAATDLEKIEHFYGQGIQLRKVFSLDESDVGVRCYGVASHVHDKPVICFTKRPDSATKGSFKVHDFEDMLYKNAQDLTENPWCFSNRWFDNHFSLNPMPGLPNFSASVHDYIVDFVDENPEIPHVCKPVMGLYFLVDPTGWALQFPSGVGSRFPARCGAESTSSFGVQDQSIDSVFCDMGNCSATDLAT